MDAGLRGEALALFEQSTRLAQNAWEPMLLAEAAHQRPRASLMWLCLGDCFRGLKFCEQALFYYRRVTELEPSSAIAIERQKECVSPIYGLMRAFNRGPLQKRWRREFDNLFGRE